VATRTERPLDAETAACPCRRGDVPAEMAGQRPLLERAAAGDREAFARLFDVQVEGVYRYLLAWTGDRAEAAELTGQVFHGAFGWLPVTAAGEGEAGAWLIAMARDAVAQRRGSGWIAGPSGPDGPAPDVVAAVARLGDPEREVVVLRLLLGHSLAHTSHLSGYSPRAVLELQLAACLAIWQLAGATRTSPTPSQAPPAATPPSAEEFERRLGHREIDLTGSDPSLADALAVASSLRRAIPGCIVAPDDALVRHLRQQLLTADPHPPPPPVPFADPRSAPRVHADAGPRSDPRALPDAGPRTGRVADGRAGGSGASTGGDPGQVRTGASTRRREGWLSRRPWVATGIATTGIVVVLALQAFGGPGTPGRCDGRPCPAPTTVFAAAAGGGVGPPVTTVLRPSTTTTTVPAPAAAPADPPSSAATAPPATRPATTAPRTTSAPRSTTTRPPSTTAATTTTVAPASTTTTVVAPAPS
jgi:DNA-directed RNA polymerase specialized sigma24 family protein